MIHLWARLDRTWDAEPIIARVTRNRQLPVPLRPQHALLVEGPVAPEPSFAICLRKSNEGNSAPSGGYEIPLPDRLNHLTEGDIIRVVPSHGEIVTLYRRSSGSNSIFLTERCNSNCVMCSQPPKNVNDSHLVDAYLQAIPLMSRDTSELGITGGEPTLLGDRLLDIIRKCGQYLPDTALHLLSNGRFFNYLSFARALAGASTNDLIVGIPLYSDLATEHDFVVQSHGAFDQTIRGIMNLRRCGVRVELRVVIHRQTYSRLPELAEFITRNIPYADHVALMGLEQMGYFKMNAESLWIDPADYRVQLEHAAMTLLRNKMHVSLYNHQLCTIPVSLWPIARKSISDWKNDYLECCNSCTVRSECGGFFSWNLAHSSRDIRPLQAEQIGIAGGLVETRSN